MFSLFALRLRRTTLSAIQLCARGIVSLSDTPTNAVSISLRQKSSIAKKISHQALKDGLAANFGPVECLWLKLPTARNAIVVFQEQAAAEKLMETETLEIPPANVTAENFSEPPSPPNPYKSEPSLTENIQKVPHLIVHNVPVEFGISASDLAKVFSRFGKVFVRHPTYAGYPRPWAFLLFKTQEAADKALEASQSEEGIIIEGSRLTATYSETLGPRNPGRNPVLVALA